MMVVAPIPSDGVADHAGSDGSCGGGSRIHGLNGSSIGVIGGGARDGCGGNGQDRGDAGKLGYHGFT